MVRIFVLDDGHVRIIEVDPLPLTLHQSIVMPVGHTLSLMNDEPFQMVYFRSILFIDSKFFRKWYLKSELLMLPSSLVYLKPFKVDHKNLGKFAQSHLFGRNLFGVAFFTVKLICLVEEFFKSEPIDAVGQTCIFFDV